MFKKLMSLVLIATMVVAVSCRKKPDCQTKKGKAKKKYYNSIQFQ